jgi:predicted nuclease of predicted toxin-antitoxin system
VKFLLDHDVPAGLLRILERSNHSVVRVAEVMPPECRDEEVIDYAAREGLVLITCNRDDFLELAKRRPHAGLLILVRRRTRYMEYSKVLRLLRSAGKDGVQGNINFA